jgi:hypothetical protein
MPGIVTTTATGVQDTDALFIGRQWATGWLSYSFPTDPAFYGTPYGSGEPGQGFLPLNTQQQAMAREILGLYAGIANLTFTELTETATQHADLRFAMTSATSTAWGYYPSAADTGGDTWYRNDGTFSSPVPGTYAYHAFIHEIGHALGLKHGQETSVFGAMTAAHDSMEYSVMTYRSYPGADGSYYYNEYSGYAQTPMLYDIAALQHMYGANFTTRAGDTVYHWDPASGQLSIDGIAQTAPAANRVFMTVWDGGGHDTYDLSAYAKGISLDLSPGAWTVTAADQLAQLGLGHQAIGNIANALLPDGDTRALIENAVCGAGDDLMHGNQAANMLDGGAGTDTLLLDGLPGDYLFAGSLADFTVTTLGTGLGVTDHILNTEQVRFLGTGLLFGIAALLLPPDDYRDTPGDTGLPLGQLAVGGTAAGHVGTTGDVDVFAVGLERGHRYIFTLAGGEGDGGLPGGAMEMLGADGNVLRADADACGGGARISFTARWSGSYDIAVHGLGDDTGAYLLSAEDVTPACSDHIPHHWAFLAHQAGWDHDLL